MSFKITEAEIKSLLKKSYHRPGIRLAASHKTHLNAPGVSVSFHIGVLAELSIYGSH